MTTDQSRDTAVLLLVRVLVLCVAAASVATVTGAGYSTDQPSCRLQAQVVFWTANDWVPLAEELKSQLSPCVEYYISIPPRAADKTVLRDDQDDVIRALGPQFHPVAEVRLTGDPGWAEWVTAQPGRTWFDVGVEFRKRMAAAGYRADQKETWLLNELDRSTRRNEAPFPRAAMAELLRGLYQGDASGPRVPGIVEIGIAYTHQNIPDVAGYKAEMKAWLADSAFWSTVAPYISVLTKEAYADARFWGVAGTSRNERARQLSEYMQHTMNLVASGPASIAAARALWTRAYMPLGNATWPALGPDPYSPPFCCGHGWTQISLDEMLSFVSEQIYANRRYVGNHRQGPPKGRFGFSWQPTNNYELPGPAWNDAKRAIASRIGAAIRYAYRPGLAASNYACRPPGGETDFCLGANVPGAAFTDAWETFKAWN